MLELLLRNYYGLTDIRSYRLIGITSLALDIPIANSKNAAAVFEKPISELSNNYKLSRYDWTSITEHLGIYEQYRIKFWSVLNLDKMKPVYIMLLPYVMLDLRHWFSLYSIDSLSSKLFGSINTDTIELRLTKDSKRISDILKSLEQLTNIAIVLLDENRSIIEHIVIPRGKYNVGDGVILIDRLRLNQHIKDILIDWLSLSKFNNDRFSLALSIFAPQLNIVDFDLENRVIRIEYPIQTEYPMQFIMLENDKVVIPITSPQL